MSQTRQIVRSFLVPVLLICAVAPVRLDADVFDQRASWAPPQAAEVKNELDGWLQEQQLDEQTRAQIQSLWSAEQDPVTGIALLERTTATIALVNESARRLLQLCEGPPGVSLPSSFAVLEDEAQPSLVRSNLRLLYGRWLAQHRFYDEAQQQLDGLTPGDVVDPASLLFYQSAVYHRLLEKQKCLSSISQLLENEEVLPRRYQAVARLMEADIKPLKTDSLNEVSRLMDDVQRRLDLGRAGKRVRQKEDEVVAKLDKMIEELERQRQQASSSSAAGNLAPSNPLPDSVPAGGKGAGNVDPKNIGNKSGWGNLPPKERQEALQQISKDLPAHYREVIEEYFRKVAQDAGQ